MASKAKLAKALAEIADLHTQLGEAYTAYGALVDIDSSKSVESGDDDDAGEVPRSKRKAGPGKSSGKGRKEDDVDDDEDDEPKKKKKKDEDDEDDEDDLPKAKAAKDKKGPTEDDVRKVALKVVKKHGKDKVEEILGGKLADVPEKQYAKKIAALEAALDEDADDEADADDEDDEPKAKSKKKAKAKKSKSDDDEDD